MTVGWSAGDIIDILIGRDHGDRADLAREGITSDDEIARQVVLDREILKIGRTQRASAAFLHLLVIIEDVDHRAYVRDGAEGLIAVAVRIHQLQDIVAVAAGVASGDARRTARVRRQRGFIVGPKNLARLSADDRGDAHRSALSQAGSLDESREHRRSTKHHREDDEPTRFHISGHYNYPETTRRRSFDSPLSA